MLSHGRIALLDQEKDQPGDPAKQVAEYTLPALINAKRCWAGELIPRIIHGQLPPVMLAPESRDSNIVPLVPPGVLAGAVLARSQDATSQRVAGCAPWWSRWQTGTSRAMTMC